MANSTTPSAGRVFISYRREETAYAAGWLFDRLAQHFGHGQIFKDIDSLEPGANWLDVITKAVASCDVLLALIGDRWLTITDGQGRARLDNPKDFVRLEIEAALARNVRVIPILVAGAQMPNEDQLPPSIAELAHRHALELSPSHFEFEATRLHKVLEKALADSQQRRHADTYRRALNAEAASEWTHAANAYAEILDVDATYRDAAARREACQARQGVVDLQRKMRHHAAAGQWPAVLDIDADLGRLDPSATDPDGLATQAQHAVDDEKRADEVAHRDIRAGNAEESPDRAVLTRVEPTASPDDQPSMDARSDGDRGHRPPPGMAANEPKRARRTRWVWLLSTALLVVGLATALVVRALLDPGSHPRTNTVATSSVPDARPSPTPTPDTPRASAGRTYSVLHAPALLYTDPNNPNSGLGQKSGTATLICARYGFPPSGTNGDNYWYYVGQNQWINDYNIDGNGNKSALVNACEGNSPHAGLSTLPPRSNAGVSSPQPRTDSPLPATDDASGRSRPPSCEGTQLSGTLTDTGKVLSLNVGNMSSSCTLPEPVGLNLLDAGEQKIGFASLSADQTGGIVLKPGTNNPVLTWVIRACSENQPSAVAHAQTADAFVNFDVNVGVSVQACRPIQSSTP